MLFQQCRYFWRVIIVNFVTEDYQINQVAEPSKDNGQNIIVAEEGDTLSSFLELLGDQLADEMVLLELNAHLELESGGEDPWNVPLPEGAEVVLPEGVVPPARA
jgi:hypothetical protein